MTRYVRVAAIVFGLCCIAGFGPDPSCPPTACDNPPPPPPQNDEGCSGCSCGGEEDEEETHEQENSRYRAEKSSRSEKRWRNPPEQEPSRLKLPDNSQLDEFCRFAKQPDDGRRWRVIKVMTVESGSWLVRHVSDTEGADMEPTFYCNDLEWPMKMNPLCFAGRRMKICGWDSSVRNERTEPPSETERQWQEIKTVRVERGHWPAQYVENTEGADMEATSICNGWNWPLERDPVISPGQSIKICGWSR